VTPAAASAAAATLVMLCAPLFARAVPGPQSTAVSQVESTASRGAPSDTALERLTRSVAAQLRCPVCQGLSLADSPSELALEMKDVVRAQLRAGRTPDEVKGYFVAKYGEWILLEPPRRGVNWIAYLLPAFAILGGLGVIWLMLGRWTSHAPSAEEAPQGGPD
jgi:cytochrome c-type biogenesis protein CcmH